MGGTKLSRASVQRDHEETSGPAEVFKFKKEKGPWGRISPCIGAGWEVTAAQGLEILVDARSDKSQGGTPPQIGKADAEGHEEEHGKLIKGCCYHLLCSEQARTPGELHPISGPQFKRDVETLEWIQQKLP